MAGESKYDQCAKECNGCSVCICYSPNISNATIEELKTELKKRQNLEAELRIKQLSEEIASIKNKMKSDCLNNHLQRIAGK